MNSNFVSFSIVAVVSSALLAFFLLNTPAVKDVHSFSLKAVDPKDSGKYIVLQSTEDSLVFDNVQVLADGSSIVNRYMSEFPNTHFIFGNPPVDFVMTDVAFPNNLNAWSCLKETYRFNSTETNAYKFVKSDDQNTWTIHYGNSMISVQLLDGRPTMFGDFIVERFEFDLSIPLASTSNSLDAELVSFSCSEEVVFQDENGSTAGFVAPFDPTCVSSRDMCLIINIYDPRFNPEMNFDGCSSNDNTTYIFCQAMEVVGGRVRTETTYSAVCTGKLDHGVVLYMVHAGSQTIGASVFDAISIPWNAFGGCLVHLGMWEWTQIVFQFMTDTSKPLGVYKTVNAFLDSNCYGGVALFGHSLGGAVSTLLAKFFSVDRNCDYETILIITAGEPASFMMAWFVFIGNLEFQHTRWVAYKGEEFKWYTPLGWFRDPIPNMVQLSGCFNLNPFWGHARDDNAATRETISTWAAPFSIPIFNYQRFDNRNAHNGIIALEYIMMNMHLLVGCIWNDDKQDCGYNSKVGRAYCVNYNAIAIPYWLVVYTGDKKVIPIYAHCPYSIQDEYSPTWNKHITVSTAKFNAVFNSSTTYLNMMEVKPLQFSVDFSQYNFLAAPSNWKWPRQRITGLANAGSPIVGFKEFFFFICDQFDLPTDLCVALDVYGNMIVDSQPDGGYSGDWYKCTKYDDITHRVCEDDFQNFLFNPVGLTAPTLISLNQMGLYWYVPCEQVVVSVPSSFSCNATCDNEAPTGCVNYDEYTCTDVTYVPFPAENGSKDNRFGQQGTINPTPDPTKYRYGQGQMYTAQTFVMEYSNPSETRFKTLAELRSSVVSLSTASVNTDPSTINLPGTSWFDPNLPVNSRMPGQWNDNFSDIPGPMFDQMYPDFPMDQNGYPRKEPPYYFNSTYYYVCLVVTWTGSQVSYTLRGCNVPTLGLHLEKLPQSPTYTCSFQADSNCRTIGPNGGIGACPATSQCDVSLVFGNYSGVVVASLAPYENNFPDVTEDLSCGTLDYTCTTDPFSSLPAETQVFCRRIDDSTYTSCENNLIVYVGATSCYVVMITDVYCGDENSGVGRTMNGMKAVLNVPSECPSSQWEFTGPIDGNSPTVQEYISMSTMYRLGEYRFNEGFFEVLGCNVFVSSQCPSNQWKFTGPTSFSPTVLEYISLSTLNRLGAYSFHEGLFEVVGCNVFSYGH